MKTYMLWTSVAIAFFLFLLMRRGVVKGEIKPSFATWIIWSLLDWIAAGSSFLAKGKFEMPLFYALGATVITILLVRTKQFSWGKLETATSFMVIACMLGWYLLGDRAGIILSSTAFFIGTIPQMVAFYREPDSNAGRVYTGYLVANTLSFFAGGYTGYLVANTLSFFAGKDWSVEERFYTGSCVTATVICCALAFRSK